MGGEGPQDSEMYGCCPWGWAEQGKPRVPLLQIVSELSCAFWHRIEKVRKSPGAICKYSLVLGLSPCLLG